MPLLPYHAPGRFDVEAEQQRAVGQAPIVSDDRIELRRNQLGCRQMYGIERAQNPRIEHSGGVEQAVVQTYEVRPVVALGVRGGAVA